MLRVRRWLRSNTAKAFVALLLGIQVVPLVQACPLPMVGVSMAFDAADMPEECAGMPKQACLVGYVQADRAPGSDCATIGAEPVTSLRIAPPVLVAAAGRDPQRPTAHAGAPPPRLLYCRMLR